MFMLQRRRFNGVRSKPHCSAQLWVSQPSPENTTLALLAQLKIWRQSVNGFQTENLLDLRAAVTGRPVRSWPNQGYSGLLSQMFCFFYNYFSVLSFSLWSYMGKRADRICYNCSGRRTFLSGFLIFWLVRRGEKPRGFSISKILCKLYLCFGPVDGFPLPLVPQYQISGYNYKLFR